MLLAIVHFDDWDLTHFERICNLNDYVWHDYTGTSVYPMTTYPISTVLKGDESVMYFCLSVCVSLVAPVDVLLLEAEDDGAEVVVVGEVVPVLRPVKVLLVRLVLHRRQTELSELQ